MKTNTMFATAVGAITMVVMTAAPARAAGPDVEVGATLVSTTISLESDNVSLIGIPSSGFGVMNPGVYASFFVGPVAIEPQVGLNWVHYDGHSDHIVNATGQVAYFIGKGTRTPYVFASAGLLEVSGSDTTPKAYGAGGGYRFRVGDRLAFRADGRYLHYTDGGGDALVFGLSIGGVFGE